MMPFSQVINKSDYKKGWLVYINAWELHKMSIWFPQRTAVTRCLQVHRCPGAILLLLTRFWCLSLKYKNLVCSCMTLGHDTTDRKLLLCNLNYSRKVWIINLCLLLLTLWHFLEASSFWLTLPPGTGRWMRGKKGDMVSLAQTTASQTHISFSISTDRASALV